MTLARAVTLRTNSRSHQLWSQDFTGTAQTAHTLQTVKNQSPSAAQTQACMWCQFMLQVL